MHPSHGHDMTIINGISRIGYMSGGKSARWTDEKIAEVITGKAVRFIKSNRDKPFFLYFSTHDIHVPRVPAKQFAGKSGLGPRGDVILEFDWSVGQIINAIDSMNLSDNTIIIVTSDNGPVVDDGYMDQAVELLNGHTPSGPLRGGKYSLLEGGTRVVFIVRWTGKVIPGVSKALFSQIDLMSSFASLTGQTLTADDAPDSFNQIDALLGKTLHGRDWVVEHSGRLSIIKDDWKLIEPGSGPNLLVNTNTETGNSIFPQLYNMNSDIGEKFNVAKHNPDLVNEMTDLLRKIRTDGRTRF
jgi:arylsulfatase A-like enzyme